MWFHIKKILFLIDDIWPTSNRPEGFLSDLEGLLQGSPESRMAISTRSLHIASTGGSHDDFGARDECGPISIAILMARVAPGMAPSEQNRKAARSILELCSELPIALSVAGAAIALRMKSGLAFDTACRIYFENISDEKTLHLVFFFLDYAIPVSLAALEDEVQKSRNGLQLLTSFSVHDLYTSLCVLQNQQFAPVSVLARMWNVNESNAIDICTISSSMSLAKISKQVFDGWEQCGLHIHDLHLDFCRRSADRSGDKKNWHRRLLNGHMTRAFAVNETDAADDTDGLHGLNMLECTPRPWWQDDLANKGYIRKQLTWHLRSAGLDIELGATILESPLDQCPRSRGRGPGVEDRFRYFASGC